MTTIQIPEDSLYGLNNLPYGVFSVGDERPRVGVRVGDQVVDLFALLGEADFDSPSLNAFMARGRDRWVEVRKELTERLAGDVPDEAIHDLVAVRLHLPIEVADYVDFYASEQHATHLGQLFRPDAEPLMPNWKHLPVGYHGRSATVVVSGTDVVRPNGQTRGKDQAKPTFGPSKRLDIEAELGFIVGTGNALGTHITTGGFAEHCFGVVILNDWSARDIQAWEYVPLGPNLGKSFATSISAWVVPLLALEDARVPLPGQDPAVLDYLAENEDWGLDIDLEVTWNGQLVSRPPYRQMYWSPAQMLSHMTVNGATSRTGDLFGSGTISGEEPDTRGAFIELTWGGAEPVQVNGEERTFLLDGDQVTISASAPGAGGRRIGLGEVTGTILPARS